MPRAPGAPFLEQPIMAWPFHGQKLGESAFRSPGLTNPGRPRTLPTQRARNAVELKRSPCHFQPSALPRRHPSADVLEPGPPGPMSVTCRRGARASSEDRANLPTYDDIAPGATRRSWRRLSARFPIISPAATLPCREPRWRVVDGGYLENSGLTTALELIDNIIRGATSAGRHVRVVLIRIENGEATKL